MRRPPDGDQLIFEGVSQVIVVVEPHNTRVHSDLLDQMFRLRARIFHDQLQWDVRVTNGRERDRYDDEGPVYIIYTDDKLRRVKGSLRLLPTTGPTLLADFFSDTLPDAVELSAPTIWECTRFCLDDEALENDHEGLLFASTVLLIALGDLAIRTGIESILGNFDTAMLRLYRRIGCEVEVLGSTRRYGQPVYLGLHPISESVVGRIKKKLKRAELAFSQARVVA
jgi:acyl homoserine lactone synthase